MFPIGLIDIISKVVPSLGSTIGNLISSKLGGVDMSNLDEVAKALEHPESQEKLKELELQLSDLKNARETSLKESPIPRLVLAIAAMFAVFADIIAIQYVTDKMLNEILIMMLVWLIWDIRQVYKFYFGSSGDAPSFPFIKKK
jgi:hypothetical protein